MKDGGPIMGADTETFNGAVKLLGFSDGTYVEPSSENYTDQLLTALYHAAKEAKWVVFWNLGFDVTAILKPWIVAHAVEFRATHYANIQRRKRVALLGLKEMVGGLSTEELAERVELTRELDGDENVERFDTDLYHVALIGSKAMSISPKVDEGQGHHKGKSREWFFDAAVWYSSTFGGVSLEYAGRKYLQRGKTDKEMGLSRERIGNEAGYYEAHRAKVIEYCVEDCRLAADLMARTVAGFDTLGYPFPDHPFSRASVSREFFKTQGFLNATAHRYQRLKLNSRSNLWVRGFSGGVFLLMGPGRWASPWALDIVSAYPDAMVHFPSLEGAVVVDDTDPRFASCFFTFYRIKLRVTPRTPTRDHGETRKIYGWGNAEESTFITGIDREVLDAMGETYSIEEAVGIWCPSRDRPLSYLKEIFDRKAKVKVEFGKDSIEYANIKVLLNGTYGLLAQRKPRESEWTNLIYASYVTAWCRRKLWLAVREVEDAGDYVVSLATDGLLVSGENSRESWKARDSAELGEWSYTAHSEAVCFESGVGFLDSTEVKKRGMPSLTREALLQCGDVEWSETRSKPLKLRSALIQKRTEMLGVFEDQTRTLCPVQSYRDAGMAFPRELVKLPLREYFSRSFKLRLRGQVGDRLTPPLDPSARARWEAVLRRNSPEPEEGYIYYPRPQRTEVAKDDTSARAPEMGEALPKNAVPRSRRGARRTKGKADSPPPSDLPSIPPTETPTFSKLKP